MSAFTNQGDTKPWQDATWNERIIIVLFWIIMWGIIFPIMCFGTLIFIGMVIEGQAQRTTSFESCQKHATTPYEYHQCR